MSPHPLPQARSRLAVVLTAAFYLVAVLAVVAPSIAASHGWDRLIWSLFGVVVLLYGMLSLLLLSRRWAERLPRLFALMGFGITLSLLFDAVDLAAGTPRGDLLLASSALVFGVNPAAWIHLCANIPRPNPVLRRVPWLIPAGYVFGVVLAAAVTVAYLAAAYGLLTAEAAALLTPLRMRVSFVWYVAAAACMLLLLGHSARHDPTPTGRRQALVVFASVLPWAVSIVVLALRPSLYWNQLRTVVETICIAIIPVGFAVSIVGYRLFEVGVVVRRGLIFGVATGLLGGAAYGASRVLEGIARELVGVPLPAWGWAMLFVVGGAVFPAVVRVIARVVDRRFFPERIALAELGRSIIPEMAGFTSLPAAATHLTQRLQQALEVEHGYLLVADASGDFFRPMALAGPGADPGTVDRLVVTGEALAAWGDDPLPLPVPALPGELAAALAATGGAYAAPVRLRQRLIGVLVLGPSVHGRPLEREALAELGNVVQQASAMLENTRLFAMATRDALTGLAQRPVLMDRLAREVERSRRTFHPFAVAFVDVDHFKAVNDTRGHQAGDAVLRRVARLLEEGSRHTDQVARYGGEEFLLLMPDTDADGARRHAEALRRSVEAAPIDAGAGADATRVTVSIGICAVASPGDLDEPEALVRAADEALYRAKNGGRNRVEWTRGAGRG